MEEGCLTADEIVNVLMSSGINDVEKTTEFLLDYLRDRDDQKEDVELQTKLLEINLKSMPEIAVAIMDCEEYKFTHYDRNYIAKLCESLGLFEKAMLNYDHEKLVDIQRVLRMGLAANTVTIDGLLRLFKDLSSENAFLCLRDLLQHQEGTFNVQAVVKVAIRYEEKLRSKKLIDLFEEFKCWVGLYLYLGNIVNHTKDSDIIYKYIFAAVEVGQYSQIE